MFENINCIYFSTKWGCSDHETEDLQAWNPSLGNLVSAGANLDSIASLWKDEIQSEKCIAHDDIDNTWNNHILAL